MEIVTAKPMMLLPPKKGLCQECATAHDPTHPHNAQSLFWGVKFKMEHGRDGKWKDAMSHCTEEMKALWTEELARLGVVV